MLTRGTPAPAFSAQDHTGNVVSLDDYRGSWILLWWYPKADTPGCTLEGKGLRDQAQTFADRNCVVLGISFDKPAENAAFAAKFDFPFPLLSDTDRSAGADYEVLRDADDPYLDYPLRISYLIDPNGTIVTSYDVTDPAGHGAEVLADLAADQR